MQTEHLISLLSATGRPVDTGWLRRTAWLGAAAALAATLVLVVSLLGTRRDLATALTTLPVLAKFAFGGSVAAIALVLFQRSLRPGLPARPLLVLVVLPVALVVLSAIIALLQAPVEQWSALTLGRNWRGCLVIVPLLALCPLGIFALLARRGAPVDRRLTGLSAGLASAGIAILAYALHCPDDTMPFMATWYTLAIGISATIATLILPRLLRW
ncbi:DUF1109 domain-containing protein [Bosea sp. (in: a-proteobacteria)]|uniref:DUF1109 domain-containing protein n=1 Tax=Bosea sp. (in: a-proteobacteria) TaxID=1871050 RepID=UPI0011FAF517|nr:DUF1109 domain-containing protein [Bosea sp. (in: a-proteobacteria)]TAJ31448.1 MAG: DUF1109 family protein [Bosea sp. (in: a-proteobacteria)]